MSTDYTGNPTATEPPAPQPAPGAQIIIRIPSSADAGDITSLNQPIKSLSDFVNWLMLRIGSGQFGNGSDAGGVTLDGAVAAPAWASKSGTVYTMTRDAFLAGDLTITGAGVVLKPNGFKLYGWGTLTTAAGGKIVLDGAAASGPTAGATGPAGTLGGNLAGGAGGAAGGGNAGANGGNTNTSYGGTGGNGGAGSAAAGTGGGQTAVSIQSSPPLIAGQNVDKIFASNATAYLVIQGGAGGGGGGSGNFTVGGAGGGGGAGGRPGIIAFRTMSLANANDITSAGGAGANGATGSGGGGTTGGGGGGGGGGGELWLIYVSKVTGLVFSAATNCPGGAPGTGATGGANGVAGGNGTVFEIPVV